VKTGEQDLDKIRSVIEAVLVTADTPVTPGRLTGLIDGLNGKDVRAAVDALNEGYREAGRAFTIVEIGGGFQLASRQEFGPWVRKYHGGKDQVRLSQAALETLSIIAFKQPITRVEVDSIRGVNSSGVMRHLHEHGLVRISGRSEGIGKPMLFGTTREFLLHFGLKSLADLPKPRELEELLTERYPAADQAAAAGEQSVFDEENTVFQEDAEAPAREEEEEYTDAATEDDPGVNEVIEENERSQEEDTGDDWSQEDAFVEERNRKARSEETLDEDQPEEGGLQEGALADG
jgi:segregation and condensation protein B